MPLSQKRHDTGKVGEYLWCILSRDGRMEYAGLSKWAQDYMMRVNNGKGRGWKRVRFVREDSK